MEKSNQEFLARMSFKYLEKYALLKQKIEQNPKWEKKKIAKRVLKKYIENHFYWDFLLTQNMTFFGRDDKVMASITSLVLAKYQFHKQNNN